MHRRLLHYEIVREIGRGGMGIVYEARDTRLDRRVAVKILPPDRVSDPARKQRFIHEAKAASALNHPNIVTVHDINSDGGVDVMVMEYIEGQTLDQLIPVSGLRPALALKYATQIADALATAHGAGIIHRDLKPSNVMATSDGRIKVLDFGLAKLVDRSESAGDDATYSARVLTDENTILGTANYMSPEQAEGRKLDGRSDIFSFGAVLYELLTGQRAFEGTSQVATIARILGDDPRPVSGIVPSLPADLSKIVTRCLRKDPARRYQHMDDVKVALEDVLEELGTGSAPASPAAVRRRLWPWIALTAAAVLAIGGILGTRWLRMRTDATPSQVRQLTTLPGAEKYPSFAPDGQQVTFTWSGKSQDNDDVYVLHVGSGQTLRLTTDPAVDISPAWSPDGNWIAFLRGQVPGRCELRLIQPFGGPERKLADINIRAAYVGPPYVSWFADSRALLVVDAAGATDSDALTIVSLDSGEKRRLFTTPPSTVPESVPAVSPDGRSVAFERDGSLFVAALEDGLVPSQPRPLTEREFNAVQPAWAPDGGSIIVSAQRRLWRVNVANGAERTQLPFVGENAFMPALTRGRPGTPDRLVYVYGTVDSNIWRVSAPDPGMPVSSPALTLSSTVIDANPQFSPDGSRIAFQSGRSGSVQAWVADSNGENASQLTAAGDITGSPRWSPDGETIVTDSLHDGQWDVYVVPASGGKPRRLTSDRADDAAPAFSRNGKWIYFASNRTGAFEIWKMPAGGGDAERVTRNGGFASFESPNGADLYYTQAEVGPSSLWKMPTAGGEPVKVLDRVAERAFVVIDSGIYYVEQQAEREFAPLALGMLGRPTRRSVGRLRFYDFQSGRITTVSDPIEGTLLGLAASPDGRTVLYTRTDAPASDLVMIDNFR